MLRIQVACADGDQLGEGPLWDVDEQRLYWIDSYGPEIHRMESNGSKKTWKLPEPIGSLVLRRSGGAILALRSGFFAFDLVPARPSASVKASQGAPVGKSGSIPTFRFIHSMRELSAPTDRAGARTDAPSTSPTRLAARSTRTTTIR
jgi:SMP-30/Gluconolactonase/LRE-like region